MAQATFVKSARKTIYEKGAVAEYISEKGKREGQTITKVDKTIPFDENDKALIKEGESYYWWKFQHKSKQYSKFAPKPSQLTQSAYLSQIYTIQETLQELTPESTISREDLESSIEDIISELTDLRDQTQESLDNMPESLQSGPTGELLQERVDSLDEAISSLEEITFDYEELGEDEIKEDIANDLGIDSNEEGWDDEIDESMIKEKEDERFEEWLGEKIEEIQSVSIG